MEKPALSHSMFVSGTTFQLLEFGQPLKAGTRIDVSAVDTFANRTSSDDKRKLSVAVRPSSSNHSNERNSPAGSSRAGGSKGGPSLLDLIEAGMLQPGDANMKVTYKGNTYAGALQSNGAILFRGTAFNTPSAFSVHVKRLVTPNKQGDDGWHSVHVDGVLLNTVRQQYLAKMLGQPYKHTPNKAQRRNQTSPRGPQLHVQQQQQEQFHQRPYSQQQQQQQPQQQQQQAGVKPPLPTHVAKLKLGNIKGLHQQQPNNTEQQQQHTHSTEQQQQQQQQQPVNGPDAQQPPQSQPAAPKPLGHKLKFKMPFKLGKATTAGTPQSASAAAVPAQQQQQQQEAASVPVCCPPQPHQNGASHEDKGAEL